MREGNVGGTEREREIKGIEIVREGDTVGKTERGYTLCYSIKTLTL